MISYLRRKRVPTRDINLGVPAVSTTGASSLKSLAIWRGVVFVALIVGMMAAWGVALADLDDGLVAHYPFNGNANDESGNGNNGTVNGATLTDDRFGNSDSAYSFDGVNNYISVGQFNLSYTQISVSVWVFLRSHTGGSPEVIGVHNSSPSEHALQLEIGGSSNNQSSNSIMWDATTSKVRLRSSKDSFSLGSWHHIVATYNGSTSSIYYDNQLLVSRSANDSYSLINATINFGTETTATGSFWDGKIDDIRLYNRALSEGEVKELYEGTPTNGDCEHATFSPKKRTLTVSFVEMPVIDFLTGLPMGKKELWKGNLRQVSGTTNRFRLIHKTVKQITDGSSSSCPATYAVETGTLSIPYLDIPIGVAIGNKKFENGVNVFKAAMTWEPMGKSFVVQEVQKLSSE